MRAYGEAIRLDPKLAHARNCQGEVLGRLGRFEESVASLVEAVRLDPEDARIFRNLGKSYQELQEHEKALDSFREAARLGPENATVHYDVARSLAALGRDEDAVNASREAIRLRPDYAEAYCNLGSYLQNLARFEESLAAYRRGHELGVKQKGWPYTSAKWVEVAEALARFDGKLAKVMRGEASPADLYERGAFLSICRIRKLWGWRARFFKEIFELQPNAAADQLRHHRYNAACAAVLAGTGQGDGPDSLTAEDRREWRDQALAWLHEDLAVWKEALAEGTGDFPLKNARRMLAHAFEDPDLAGVRDAESLATMGEKERGSWSAFWADVRAALETSMGK